MTKEETKEKSWPPLSFWNSKSNSIYNFQFLSVIMNCPFWILKWPYFSLPQKMTKNVTKFLAFPNPLLYTFYELRSIENEYQDIGGI
jgi:hypothetical protein